MNVTVDLVGKYCPTCGIAYAVPNDWFEALSNQHDRGDNDIHWFCPNGHRTVFGRKAKWVAIESERDRLKQDNARLEQMVADARRDTLVIKKEIKRQAKRAAAGVCPCCHRTFRQLVLHMKNKHPDQVRKLLPAPEVVVQ